MPITLPWACGRGTESRGKTKVKKPPRLSLRRALILYAVADVVCVGLGMGVPIFCILLGLPVGWYLGRRVDPFKLPLDRFIASVLLWAAGTSALTLAGMLVLWGPQIWRVWAAEEELANFGVPMILYRPRASFIAWLFLVIAVSPLLQFLFTLFGALIGVRAQVRSRAAEGESP